MELQRDGVVELNRESIVGGLTGYIVVTGVFGAAATRMNGEHDELIPSGQIRSVGQTQIQLLACLYNIHTMHWVYNCTLSVICVGRGA